MALNIPLPDAPGEGLLKGIESGRNMFSSIMDPILKREQQKQLDAHFKQQMELRKQQFARSGANSGIQRQILEQQLLGLQHKNDPEWEYNQFNKMFGGSPATSGNQDESGGQSQGQAYPALHEMFSGQGIFPDNNTDSGNTDMVNNILGDKLSGDNMVHEQRARSVGVKPGENLLEVLRNDPIKRGYFKHKFGFDPLAVSPQTPEEKQAASIDLFKQKEDIRKQNKGGEVLTNAIKTKYQSVMGGAKSSLPIIDNIISETKKGKIPGQAIGSFFKRDAQANYKGEISTLLDGIRNAYTIPNTDSGTAKAEDKVLRKSGESDTNYINRLSSIRKQIVERESDARAKLGAGNIMVTDSGDEFSKMSDDELRKIAGGG